MTAANEKPDCPCCQLSDTAERKTIPSESHNGWRICFDCGCTWDPAKRRAQTAEGVDLDSIDADIIIDAAQAFENAVPHHQHGLSEWMGRMQAALNVLARARGGE